MLNKRTLIDLNLAIALALPAAGANGTSTVLDTASVNPGRLYDVELILALPALPSLADTKNALLKLQDSQDNVTFTDTPGVTITSLGAGGVGAAANSLQVKIPIGTGRYLRLYASVDAAGGNNTALSGTLNFAF